MSDDPDELKAEMEARRKRPLQDTDYLNAIDWHLRYGIPSLKFIGWVIVMLLALILWRIW
jgi:hypothetical protein